LRLSLFQQPLANEHVKKRFSTVSSALASHITHRSSSLSPILRLVRTVSVLSINQNQPSKNFYSRRAVRFPGFPEDWVSLQSAIDEGVEPLGVNRLPQLGCQRSALKTSKFTSVTHCSGLKIHRGFVGKGAV
jgi:hypothetical protein